MNLTTKSGPGREYADNGKREPRTPQSSRHLWALRAGGVVLAIFGWALASLDGASPSQMLLNAAVIGCVAAYGMVAGSISRRVSTNGEKKLRLDLLVHNMELENMSVRDDLTHLFNRQYFFERLAGELDTARGLQRPLAIVLIDIDELRAINQSHGHLQGNEALKRFAQFLVGLTRTSDVPARIGGDEFAIILPDTSPTAAEVMVARIQKALENEYSADGSDSATRLTASVGASGFPWGGDDADAIMLQAEASLLANKRTRKHPLRVLSDATTDRTDEVPEIYRKSPQATDA